MSAIYRALAERRFDEAAELSERNWSLLLSRNVSALRAVADNLPDEVLAGRPSWERIRRYLGFIMTDSAIRPAAYVETAAVHPPRTLLDRLILLTSRSIAARTAGHSAEALALTAEAEQELDDAAAGQRRLAEERLADLYFQWGLSYEFAAQEPASLAAYENAFNHGMAWGNALAAADAAGQLAWLHALCGRGRLADEWIARAEALAEANQVTAYWRRGDILASAVRAADRLHPDLADALLDTRPRRALDEHRLIARAQRAIFRLSAGTASPVTLLSGLKHAVTADLPLFAEAGANDIVFGYVEAVIHLYSEQPERAIELLDGVAERGGEPFVIGTRAIVRLAAGAEADALRDADRALSNYAQWPRLLVPASLVRAIVAADHGDRDAAAQSFLAACELAEADGILSTLTTVSHADITRLIEFAGEDRVPAAVRELARRPLLFAPSRKPRPQLTAQELRVLRGLAAEGSLADIAGRLHLSLNTLKAHTRSIYRKLGVASRKAALDAAHDRGLI